MMLPSSRLLYRIRELHSILSTALASLGPAAFSLNYFNNVQPHLTVIDQFFLCLVKLRTYKPNFELSRLFRICESEVYSIFVTWVRFMSVQWREINIWPSRENVKFFAPFDFKDKFPETRVIVDGMENPVRKPRIPAAQQLTFSSYKNRNTAKTVIGITPGGLTSLITQTFGGSASDRQIIERSGLLNVLCPGDQIMADKGFDVQDIFAASDVHSKKLRHVMCLKAIRVVFNYKSLNTDSV